MFPLHLFNIFFFLPVLATSFSKKAIIFVCSWKILEKLPSKSFLNCYQGIMGKGDIESFTFHSSALRSSKFMVLRLGWGSAVRESVNRVGKTGWEILGSFTEGYLPSSYVASSHEPSFQYMKYP